MTHDELYTDGVGQITVSGGIVRVDLVSLSPSERDENNNPKPTFRQRLIFPLQGFAKSVELMQKALQGLVDAGVIQSGPISNVDPSHMAKQRRPRNGTKHASVP